MLPVNSPSTGPAECSTKRAWHLPVLRRLLTAQNFQGTCELDIDQVVSGKPAGGLLALLLVRQVASLTRSLTQAACSEFESNAPGRGRPCKSHRGERSQDYFGKAA
jgi:hypothetical protein